MTYGLIGMELPSASSVPPTMATVPNPTLSATVTLGDAVTRIAAAAGVHTMLNTSNAPTTWTDAAIASPRTSMKIGERSRTGTPRAAATSGSRLANRNGRHITNKLASTTRPIAISQES